MLRFDYTVVHTLSVSLLCLSEVVLVSGLTDLAVRILYVVFFQRPWYSLSALTMFPILFKPECMKLLLG